MVKIRHNPSPEIAQERAARIRRLRNALRFSRPIFCQKYSKYGITTSALQGWEDVRWYGLTENGAIMLAQAFQDEGLNVTVEWLMYGTGEDPILDHPSFPQKNIVTLTEEDIIARELQVFHKNNSNAVDTIIVDDALEPWLSRGDRVAGIRYFDGKMERAIGHPSIIQTLDGVVLVRMVAAGSDVELYNLACTNPKTKTLNPTLKNIKLFSAAPILWIRKREIQQ